MGILILLIAGIVLYYANKKKIVDSSEMKSLLVVPITFTITFVLLYLALKF